MVIKPKPAIVLRGGETIDVEYRVGRKKRRNLYAHVVVDGEVLGEGVDIGRVDSAGIAVMICAALNELKPPTPTELVEWLMGDIRP